VPRPSEVAIISVAGQQFEDWESVYVKCQYLDPWSVFSVRAPLFEADGVNRDVWLAQFSVNSFSGRTRLLVIVDTAYAKLTWHRNKSSHILLQILTDDN
jgi:hypothetical protein